MESPGLHNRGPVHTASEGFCTHVLLLLLLKLYTEIKLFPTGPTPQQFLAVFFSLVRSQVENVSQDWTTHLTGVGLPARLSCLGRPGL